jgi:transposase
VEAIFGFNDNNGIAVFAANRQSVCDRCHGTNALYFDGPIHVGRGRNQVYGKTDIVFGIEPTGHYWFPLAAFL